MRRAAKISEIKMALRMLKQGNLPCLLFFVATALSKALLMAVVPKAFDNESEIINRIQVLSKFSMNSLRP